MRKFLTAFAVASALCASAAAQLPSLPDVVGGATRGPLGGVLGAAEDAAGATGETLRTARERALRALRLAHPDLLDRDPRGATIVRSEILALAPSDQALAAAEAAGFEIVRRDSLGELDVAIVVLRAPARIRSTRTALARLRALDPHGAYDFNHLYSGAGATGAAVPMQARAGAPSAGVRVGMIDGGVDPHHPALAGAEITQRAFAGPNVVASAHGAAVASLIAGQSEGFRGAAPGASLFIADVYGGAPTGGSAAAVARAFAWLAAQRTPVINASIVGPPNAALEAVVRAVVARGHVVVAAVGNDGPAAAPLYPASYPGVIGVTGVDGRDRALIEAARGRQVDIAAPGADMAAANLTGFAAVRGTSFAAPIAAGLLARELRAPSREAAQQALALLAAQAADLGPRGPDPVYGAGLVGRAVRVAPRTLAAR